MSLLAGLGLIRSGHIFRFAKPVPGSFCLILIGSDSLCQICLFFANDRPVPVAVPCDVYSRFWLVPFGRLSFVSRTGSRCGSV